MGNVFLQLCPEDDSEHGEADGSSQSNVRVQQHGEDEGCHPNCLDKNQRASVMSNIAMGCKSTSSGNEMQLCSSILIS